MESEISDDVSNDFMRMIKKSFTQNSKIESARRRRNEVQKIRETHAMNANKRRAEITDKAMQKRWIDDANRNDQAFQLRKQNEELVMLRKVFIRLLILF